MFTIDPPPREPALRERMGGGKLTLSELNIQYQGTNMFYISYYGILRLHHITSNIRHKETSKGNKQQANNKQRQQATSKGNKQQACNQITST